MKKVKNNHFTHIILWVLIYLFIFSIAASFTNDSPNVIFDLGTHLIILVITITLIIPFYFTYFVYPLFFNKKKSKRNLTLLSSAIFLAIYSYFSLISVGRGLLFGMLVSLCFYGSFMFFGFIFRNFFEFFKQEEIKNGLEKEKYKSEIAMLKNTLNPHFFFNSLNMIDSLIFIDQQKASDVLIELSDIIRYMIYETNADVVDLKQEIEYLQKYINIIKSRFSYDEVINFEVIGKIDGIMIAPMIFINFIENAIKHTTNLSRNSRIDIRMLIKESQIIFTVKNEFNPLSQNQTITKVAGIGLPTVRKRLELLYPKRHYLKINNENHIFFIELWIETNEN